MNLNEFCDARDSQNSQFFVLAASAVAASIGTADKNLHSNSVILNQRICNFFKKPNLSLSHPLEIYFSPPQKFFWLQG